MPVAELQIAKSLLRSKKSALSLDDHAIEDICLTSSREFYDNASSGNYTFGDMKLAYDWCVNYPSLLRYSPNFVSQPVDSVAFRECHS
jgi:hypothetical protein